MPIRTAGWQKRLITYIAATAEKGFMEGQRDCGLFGADALAAQTGVDLAAPYRGRYTTTRGGLRVLRRDGYADHVALAAAHLRTRSPLERARPGDLAVIPTGGVPALGVVQRGVVYILSPAGLGMVPVAMADQILEVL